MKKKMTLISAKIEDFPTEFWRKNIPEMADFEFIHYDSDRDNLNKHWREILKTSDGIIIDREISSHVLPLINGVPRRIGEIQCIDVMAKDPRGNWWPECFFREALHEGIIKSAEDLDTSASGYLTGEGSLMRVGMSVLVQLGFRKINLVLENPEDFETLSDSFKRLYFDTDIRLMRNTDLTLQKNDGTILINTVKLRQHPELQEDLTYLNFIIGAGLVVDTQGDRLTNPVLDEALNVGLRILPGCDVQSAADWQVLNTILGGLQVSQTEFVKKWGEFVKTSYMNEKPDISPVTKEGR